MAYVNGTTHYNLPQTVGTDKRDWADTNQAFADIDAAIYGAVSDVAQAEEDISSLKTRMDTAEGNIVTNTSDISALDTRLTTAEGAITAQAGQITDTKQDLEDMICAYNEASATSTHAYAIGDYFIYNDVLYRATQVIAIGDTIVPDTNCATTNVTTEIHDLGLIIPSVDGKADISIIAPIETGSTSTATYYAGQKFYLNNTLRCATIKINVGDDLVNKSTPVTATQLSVTIVNNVTSSATNLRDLMLEICGFINDNIAESDFTRVHIYAWGNRKWSITDFNASELVVSHSGGSHNTENFTLAYLSFDRINHANLKANIYDIFSGQSPTGGPLSQIVLSSPTYSIII